MLLPEDKNIAEVVIDEALIQIWDNGMVYLRFREYVEIDVPVILKVFEKVGELTNNQKYRLIVELEVGAIATKEAREYSVSEGHESNKIAWAAISKNIAQRVLFNFLLKINKPKIPFRIFSNINDANEWLKKF